MASNTPVIHTTRRYGNTTYAVNAYFSKNASCSFEEKLLELIRNESEHQDSDQSTAIVAGTEPTGCTMKFTLRLQENNGTSWCNVSSTVTGNAKAKASYTGVSGRAYRGYYTYRFYDASGTLLESGSGYTNVKKIN